MSTTALYSPYKAVGYVTDGNPFCINRLGEDTFLTTSVGKAFQVGALIFTLLRLPTYPDMPTLRFLTNSLLLNTGVSF